MSLLLLAALALAGCGGSGSAATVPTADQVSQCVIAGGGQKWGQTPLLPKGFPKHLEESATVGPEFGHITVYISPSRVFDRRTVEGFHEFGEYRAQLVYGGRGLLLLDSGIGKKDRQLAFKCLAAG